MWPNPNLRSAASAIALVFGLVGASLAPTAGAEHGPCPSAPGQPDPQVSPQVRSCPVDTRVVATPEDTSLSARPKPGGLHVVLAPDDPGEPPASDVPSLPVPVPLPAPLGSLLGSGSIRCDKPAIGARECLADGEEANYNKAVIWYCATECEVNGISWGPTHGRVIIRASAGPNTPRFNGHCDFTLGSPLGCSASGSLNRVSTVKGEGGAANDLERRSFWGAEINM